MPDDKHPFSPSFCDIFNGSKIFFKFMNNLQLEKKNGLVVI